MVLKTLRTTGVDYNDVSAVEIVAIARAQKGLSWNAYGCTDFVWAVANLAGANYGSRALTSGETYEGIKANDSLGRVVPRLSSYDDAPTSDTSMGFQHGRWNVWDTERYTSATSLNSTNLRAGDIVRIYDGAEPIPGSNVTTGVHSFVVTSVSSSGITVVDNWPDGTGTINEHSLTKILSSGTFGNSISSAYVSRIVNNTSNSGSSYADLLIGTSSSNAMDGGNGNDTIYGRGGNDVILGGAGNDDLRGGSGADKITGGYGADLLRGGSGADTFILKSALETPVGTSYRDSIVDFEKGIDKIDVSGIDARSNVIADQAFLWIGYTTFHKISGELRGTGSTIQGDTNGDGIADFEFNVTANLASISLSSSDFIL
jgi:RTX calcium-binding nonapeptide repeat (4 copies)